MKKNSIFTILLCIVFVLSAAALTGCSANTAKEVQAAASAAARSEMPEGQAPVSLSVPVAANLNYKVSMDVNPSIELSVSNGIVSGVQAYNDDAQKLLLNVDVSGLNANEAVKKLVEELAGAGYITNAETKPYLVITTVSGSAQTDAELTETLKENAKEALKTLNLKCHVKAAGASGDVAAKAESLGLSVGRYMLLNFIAGKENIPIEEAISKYGSLKVAEMMHRYEDMDGLFDDDDDIDDDLAAALTPEQLAVFDSAKTNYNTAIRSAESAYDQTIQTAKADFKTKLEAIKQQLDPEKDEDAYITAVKALQSDFNKIWGEARTALKNAVDSAKTAFNDAVASLNLDRLAMEDLLDYEVDDLAEIDDDFGEDIDDEDESLDDDQEDIDDDDDEAMDDDDDDDDEATDGQAVNGDDEEEIDVSDD